MSDKTFIVNGVKLTIQRKPAFEMIGYKKAVRFGDGSIGSFIDQLTESGKLDKLAHTVPFQQQIWVCLSDCQKCDRGCSDFDACCRVCVEKTDRHDFSQLADDELTSFQLPGSEWVLYEATNDKTVRKLHQIGAYELVKEVNFNWNDTIRLHFDNEHECYRGDEWIAGKTYRFLMPVVPV